MKIQLRSIYKSLSVVGAVSLLCGTVQADSIWSDEMVLSLVADSRAHAVGDIISVIVQESNTTRKDSNTKTTKNSKTDAAIQSFLFSPGASKFMSHNGQLPAIGLTSNNEFDGGGSINNSESINSRFGVRVVDVLPNRNLIVEGLRQTSFAGESRTIVLRGTVRMDDVSADNTVFSFSLADVSIKFSDSGAISNSQKKGWFNRAWDVLTPF